jgi:hypothetical protein
MMTLYAAVRYAFGVPPALYGNFGGMGYWFGTFPGAEGMFRCSVGGGYFFRTLFQLHQQEQRATRLALELGAHEEGPAHREPHAGRSGGSAARRAAARFAARKHAGRGDRPDAVLCGAGANAVRRPPARHVRHRRWGTAGDGSLLSQHRGALRVCGSRFSGRRSRAWRPGSIRGSSRGLGADQGVRPTNSGNAAPATATVTATDAATVQQENVGYALR